MSKETGARIRAARKAAGLSQENLAKAVEGVSAYAISKAERGEKELSPEQLKAIATAKFGVGHVDLAYVDKANVIQYDRARDHDALSIGLQYNF